ncbi:hypothetical protein KJS94_13780 [Flavihumibacter rivuli]|uniref:hypothetical protein n=1 Tax=Flavihumibacter rivuli TaxID=2838156 RepID=UPI001BDDDE39|nr:hypothetical protein [Flavihumibacter rivuli]ULQ55714.1 hypothetical protein KJS94_13780 [Flavihumibacter rivuli]
MKDILTRMDKSLDSFVKQFAPGWLALIFILPSMGLTYVLDRWLWKDFKISNGEEMLAFYVGPMTAVLLAFCLSYFGKMSTSRVMIAGLVACLAIQLPLFHHIPEVYDYVSGTDSHLYQRAANYMYEHKTLCSYDGHLLGTNIGNHYLYQPGYKYYLAALLFLTDGQLFRVIQFIGELFILMTMISLVCTLRKEREIPGGPVLVSLFFIGMVPSLLKSMLMGLTEWLAILMMILSFLTYHRRWYGACLVFLGLAAFVRQTFVPVALVSSFFVFPVMEKNKGWNALAFSLVLCLPFLHNYFFAGKLVYFADYSWWAERMSMTPKEYFWFSMVEPYELVFLQYFGIDVGFFSITNEIMSLLFIPLGWVVLWKMGKALLQHETLVFWGWLFLAALLVMPSLAYNGTACFPRFQMFNFSALIFLSLYLIGAALFHNKADNATRLL